LIEQHLTDSRHGKNTQFPFTDLLRQSCQRNFCRTRQAVHGS
jgi:hypothetical protein